MHQQFPNRCRPHHHQIRCEYSAITIDYAVVLYLHFRMTIRVARRPVFAGTSRFLASLASRRNLSRDAICPIFFDGRLWFTRNNQLEQSKSHKCHCDVVLNVLTKVYI